MSYLQMRPPQIPSGPLWIGFLSIIMNPYPLNNVSFPKHLTTLELWIISAELMALSVWLIGRHLQAYGRNTFSKLRLTRKLMKKNPDKKSTAAGS